ncbi:glycosyltransferase [Oenococcus sicerae]|uniref:Glycosyltransferase n=1 Tax=Oenococcus sicerae TaxID=2203724 RepID=A0AAJ1VPS3_9LACO|nr:glycosyltransferase [Oenococcus sicerae]MDN6901089.1 glycosyltransferase [Oenococcus sicerae]
MKLTSTVIMGTYNGSAFVYDQLASILEQTSPVTKVIIRDDGSTDGTSKMIEQFIDHYGLHQTWDFQINDDQKGWRKNFMDMLTKIETDLVFFSDQDDIWYSDKVSTFLKAFSHEQQAELIVSDYDFQPKDQTLLTMYTLQEKQAGCEGLFQLIPNVYNLATYRPGCSMALKESMIPSVIETFNKIAIGPNGLAQSHDEASWLTAILRGSLYHLAKPLFSRRSHADSTWQSEKKAHQHYFETANREANFTAFVQSIDRELKHGHWQIEQLQSDLKNEINLYVKDSKRRNEEI